MPPRASTRLALAILLGLVALLARIGVATAATRISYEAVSIARVVGDGAAAAGGGNPKPRLAEGYRHR